MRRCSSTSPSRLRDGTTLLGSASADSKGNWSVTSSLLSEGNHTLTVRQQDAAGNLSPAGSTLSVVIDATVVAPATPTLAAASDSGAAGDSITNVTTPTVTGTAEANAAITLYDTDGVTVLGTATASNTGAWSIVASTLGEGSHTLTAVQRDRAGNLSAASTALALEIDTQAPEAPGVPALAAASDSGTAGDNITNVGRPVVTGTAAANATVTLYDTDGTTILGTTTADGAGNWSIISSTLAVGEHTLSAKQADAAGNVSAASLALSLTILAPPPPPPVTPPSGTIDGVPVTQQPVTLPGGGAGTQVTIPVITPDRVDDSGSAGLADIPLATSNGASLLLAQLPTGVGLSATGGGAVAAGDPLQHLIQAIVGATPGYSPENQGHLTGNGLTFLGQLSASVPLLVQTIVPASGATAPGGPLTLTGTSTPELHTALVIDTRGLAPDATVRLNAVDFAAVVGAANVSAGTAGQILSSDQAVQRFTVGADSASAVFSGAGNDTLVFGAAVVAPGPEPVPATAAGASASALLPLAGVTPGATILHGGLDVDSASFVGNLDAYTVERHQSYVTVTSVAQPQQTAVVINAESLVFADTTVAIEHGEAITAIAGLYRDTLGRQADYLGIDFWTQGVEDGVALGRIALDIITSPESQARQAKVFNGDNAHDLDILYQAIFSRQGDAEGVAFWSAALDAGATLEQVAGQFMVSQEIATHMIDAARWDFLVL